MGTATSCGTGRWLADGPLAPTVPRATLFAPGGVAIGGAGVGAGLGRGSGAGGGTAGHAAPAGDMAIEVGSFQRHRSAPEGLDEQGQVAPHDADGVQDTRVWQVANGAEFVDRGCGDPEQPSRFTHGEQRARPVLNHTIR